MMLLLCAACTKPSQSPDRVPPSEPPPPLRFPRLPALVGGSDEPRYQQALATWKTATTAYALGDTKIAGERFIAAATDLMTSSVAPHGGAFRAGRCAAYDNAASAYGEAACPHLEELKAKDPGCVATIRKICASTSTSSDP